MPSESPLSLFPSATSNHVPKSCLKQPARTVRTPSPACDSPAVTKPEGLRGLAVQFTPRQAKTIIVEPAQVHIKHSLFCEPEDPRSDSPMDGAQAQPGPQSPRPDSPRPLHQASPGSPPIQTYTRSSAPRRIVSPQPPPQAGSPQSNHTRSPVQRRASTHVVNGAHKQSPPPLPDRSVSQPATIQSQSIFPVYDHSIPLSQQHYYPPADLILTPPEPAVVVDHQHRRGSSATRPALKLATSSTSTSSAPQIANLSQLQALWSATNGSFAPNQPQKVRLAMHREIPLPSTSTTSTGNAKAAATVDLGFSDFYTFTHRTSAATQDDGTDGVEVVARRRHPLKEEVVVPIALVELAAQPEEEDSGTREPVSSPILCKTGGEDTVPLTTTATTTTTTTTIFPQTCALSALERAATSPTAHHISRFDPRASGPEAAQLAFDAVASAKREEECVLLCTTSFTAPSFSVSSSSSSSSSAAATTLPFQQGNIRGRSSRSRRQELPGEVQQRQYTLRHPRLGDFSVNVKGRIDVLGCESGRGNRDRSRYDRHSRGGGRGGVGRSVGSYQRISISCPSRHFSISSESRSSRVGIGNGSGREKVEGGERKELLVLDLTQGHLDLDLQALSKLDSAFITDTLVCAAVAVAFAESEFNTGDLGPAAVDSHFAAPPGIESGKAGRSKSKSKSGGGSGSISSKARIPSRLQGWTPKRGSSTTPMEMGMEMSTIKEKPLPSLPRRSTRDRKRKEKEEERGDFKIPGVVRVVLKLLGWSFKAVLWLLGLGVKVLTKMLVKIGHAAGG